MKSDLNRESAAINALVGSAGSNPKRAMAALSAGYQNPIIAFAMTPLFQCFALLQVLDAVTTLAVLQNGGYEANPLVNNLMALGAFNGLVIAKLLAIAVGAAVLSYGRTRVLVIANFIYAAIICWNLTALFAA